MSFYHSTYIFFSVTIPVNECALASSSSSSCVHCPCLGLWTDPWSSACFVITSQHPDGGMKILAGYRMWGPRSSRTLSVKSTWMSEGRRPTAPDTPTAARWDQPGPGEVQGPIQQNSDTFLFLSLQIFYVFYIDN